MRVQGRLLPVGRVAAGRERRVFHVVAGEEAQQLFDLLDAVGVGVAGELGHAALGVVGHGAAQVLKADLLAGDALDDVRAGDEHVGGVLHHEDEVGHGRGVDRAAGGGSHDGRDLGDDAGGDGVAIKDLAVAAQSESTPSWMRAPPESLKPTRGTPAFRARSMTLQIFLACISPKLPARAVKSWEKAKTGPAVHLAVAGDDAVGRDLDLFHAEVDRSGG